MRPAEIPFPVGRNIHWRKYAIGAAALAVAILCIELYRDDGSPVASVDSNQVVLPAMQVAGDLEKPPLAASLMLKEMPAPSSPAGPANGLREQTPGVDSPGAALPTSEPRKLGEHLLRFKFAQDSWVEVRDRSGRKIFSQLNPAGTEQAVGGTPPFKLIVGNANGVDLSHNEQPVNLVPYISVDVARLTVE